MIYDASFIYVMVRLIKKYGRVYIQHEQDFKYSWCSVEWCNPGRNYDAFR